MVDSQSPAHAARDRARRRMGRGVAEPHAARRAAGSVRHAGDRQGVVSGQGAAGRRRSGDLSADDHVARRARREDDPRVFVVRRRVRLRAVRRQDRSVLGTLACARVSEPGSRPPAARRERRARAGRDGRRLGLRIRARRQERAARSGRTARVERLVPEVRAEGRARCRGGRERRRDGAPVSGRARSRQAARVRHHAGGRRRRARQGEQRIGRLRRRDGGIRVHGARERLPALARRLPQRRAAHERIRHAGAARRRRARADRPGDATRHRRAQRRGRGRGRRDRDAFRQERAVDDRGREGEARRAQAFAARGRRARDDVRSLATDRARGRQSEGQAHRGVRGRRARVRIVPVSSAQRVRRDPLAAARRSRRVHRDAPSGRQREPDVARRHRDRDRRDDRRGRRDDRKRAQAPRIARARASGRAAVECGALGADRGVGGRSRARALFLAADRHAVVRSGVRARRSGRQTVRAARVHEDVIRSRRRRACRSRSCRC